MICWGLLFSHPIWPELSCCQTLLLMHAMLTLFSSMCKGNLKQVSVWKVNCRKCFQKRLEKTSSMLFCRDIRILLGQLIISWMERWIIYISHQRQVNDRNILIYVYIYKKTSLCLFSLQVRKIKTENIRIVCWSKLHICNAFWSVTFLRKWSLFFDFFIVNEK